MQYIGSKMDAVEERKLGNLLSAQQLFESAAKRMFAVNHWKNFSPGTQFQLFDLEGNALDRSAKVGDFVRIDIPGPGPASGGGYDWVNIEDIKLEHHGDTDFAGMRVRPCSSLLEAGNDIAHFLKDKASSTFVIRRDRIRVWAEEHGRNEVPNIEAEKLMDKARNLVVGFSAKIGLSYPQWKCSLQGYWTERYSC